MLKTKEFTFVNDCFQHENNAVFGVFLQRLYNFEIADFELLDNIIKDQKHDRLFFDEIQAIQGWELYVRQKLDEGYKVTVTGSNTSLLSRELGSKLTGRHITKELFLF